LNVERFIAARITDSNKGKNNISKPIVKIGIIGIALGISVMILTVSIVFGFKRGIIDKITGITSHISISNVNINSSNEPDPLIISQDTLNLMSKMPSVKHIQTTAGKDGIIKTKTENEGIFLKGISKDYNFDFIKKYLVNGNIPAFSDTTVNKQILISKKLANRLNINLSQKLLVYFITKKKLKDTTFAGSNFIEYEQRVRDFTVCGIFNTGFAEIDNNLAFVDIKQIQKLNYWNPKEVGSYEVFLSDFSQLDKEVEKFEEILGYNYRITSVKQAHSNIFSWLEMVDVNGIIIVTLMLIVAGVNMITALLILILERANMVGLVKSIGMSNFSVRKIFFNVSLKLLLKGLLYGNLIGIGLVGLQYYTHLIKLDGETYYMNYVPVIFNIAYIGLLNLGIIVSCLLMMFFPTLILTKLTPIRTLRFD
jgi:lipoprotein-releasing system permease protein